MALYPNLIKEALQTVRYPGTGKDIISMEMLDPKQYSAVRTANFRHHIFS